MARGNLRTATAPSERLQTIRQRQFRLRRIPPSRQLSGDHTSAVHLHSETFEAERPRTLERWVFS
jgi:hypothetical protein